MSTLLKAIPLLLNTATLRTIQFADYFPKTALVDAINEFMKTFGSRIETFMLAMVQCPDDYFQEASKGREGSRDRKCSALFSISASEHR